MAYPRRCPLCETDYDARKGHDRRHATLGAESGGTPSPGRPRLPGRLLALRCRACGGEYGWDYFAGRPPAGAVLAPRLPQRAEPARWPWVAPPGSPSRVY
jgi:hypothetical protein